MTGNNKMQFGLRRCVVVAAAMSTLVGAVGCSHQASADLSATQKQALDKTDAIAMQSQGDWEKISPADRQYLIQTAGYGNEASARQFIAGLARHLARANAPLGGGPRSRPKANSQ